MNMRQVLKARPKSPMNWVMIGVLITWTVFSLTTVWAVASDWSTQADKVTGMQGTIADHEQRLRIVEQQITEIATDVRWVREHLEEQ
ncbi:MAG: hypothetical protein WD294_02305 [Phycisphaeraceae bacterium]